MILTIDLSKKNNIKMALNILQEFSLEFEKEATKEAEGKLVSSLNLTVRTANVLTIERIDYIEDLLKYTPKRLLSLNNFGKGSLLELIDVLEDKGLSLAT